MLFRLASVALLVGACGGSAASPDASAPDASARDATTDTSAPDASTDASAPDASTDASAPDVSAPDASAPDVTTDASAPDVTTDASVRDASVDAGPPACSDDTAAALLAAIRAAPAAGTSVVAAPGQRFDALRTAFDANPTSRLLLERVRAYARGTPTTIAAGDTGSFQTWGSRAMGAALVAWHDNDATATAACLRTLAAMAIAPEWLRTAPEVPLRMGAAMLAMAAAIDLLSATPAVTAEQLATARANLATLVASLEAWLQAGGLLFTAVHLDNHSMRFAGGFAAAARVLPASALGDDLLRWSLAQMSASVGQQTGALEGWAEGSMYMGYGFEVAAPALTAIDRAWTGGDSVCVRCPGHAISACGAGAVRVWRPSADVRLRDLVQWSASLESDSGTLAYVDDSRASGVPAALFEQMVQRRAYAHWNVDGAIGSTGTSLLVHPLLALAHATPAPTETLPLRRLWVEGGTARLDGRTATMTALQAFVIGEHDPATRGVGHERPDVATLALFAGGAMMLGPSGYNGYDDRAPFARADAATGITVEGLLARDLGAGLAGPDATLAAMGEGVSVGFGGEGVTVSRAVVFEGTELVVRDTVDVTGATRDVGWHWHLRGSLDADRWSWTVGTRRCTVTQTGEAPTLTRETAAHYDVAGRAEMHPVVRQLARLAAGRRTLTTRIACE